MSECTVIYAYASMAQACSASGFSSDISTEERMPKGAAAAQKADSAESVQCPVLALYSGPKKLL